MEADADEVRLQLSFAAAFQTANDSQNILSTLHALNNLVTSGMTMGRESKTISGISIPVKAGERIYLHAVSITSATFSSSTTFHLI
uniref:hypothetical protein n=1 Tax=Rheinheimera sp. TaxID=1869214 RepID=UPI0040488098